MGGGHEKMSLCLTDPPYSANYGTRKNEENITPQLASYLDSANAEELLRGFMSLLPTEFIVMTYTDKQLHPYVRVCDSLNFETIDLLIWEKQNFCFWPGARYQQQHELIFLTRKKGAKIISHVPSNQSTILYIDRKMNNDIHPTEKPLALWGLLLKYHSDSGALVYDPFLGSGTTLIACEQMDRICFGMEIVPYYIDVILDRYAKFTGNDPIRESDGKMWSELKHEPHSTPEDSARAARHDVE